MKIAVVLAGCGHLDGSEITEAVSVLIALDRAGAEVTCCAPDLDQFDVVDHLRGEPVPGRTRGVLAEAARIARGKVQPIDQVWARDFDALVFPGGFGVAKHLCSFAKDGPACNVNPDVERLILEAHGAGRPIALVCIAPVLAAKVLGARGASPLLTIGHNPETAAALESMGARHQECPATDCVVDEKNRLVTTPAYMAARGPGEVFEGVGRCIDALLRLAADRS